MEVPSIAPGRKRAREIRKLLQRPVKEEPKEEEDEEDEDALLLRELAKIKAEKAERSLEEKNADIFNAATKSWREDAVFGKGETNKAKVAKKGGGLYNDIIKSDFHRKFLDRYIAK